MSGKCWVLLIAIAMALTLLTFLARRHLILYRVIGDSMEPSLFDGDIVIATRLCSPSWEERLTIRVGRGEVVALSVLAFDKGVLLKRVVGMPRDRLEMRNGALYANGIPVDRHSSKAAAKSPAIPNPPGSWHYSFLAPDIPFTSYTPSGMNWGPIIVPEHSVFVMGDHHQASGDSRSFGFVVAPELVARVHVAFSLKNGLRIP